MDDLTTLGAVVFATDVDADGDTVTRVASGTSNSAQVTYACFPAPPLIVTSKVRRRLE